MLHSRPRWREVANSLAPLASLLALSVFLGLREPAFLTRENLLNVGVQTAVIAVLALGETLVIVSGGIDLSVGSVLALSGIVMAMAMQAGWGGAFSCVAGVAIGAGCGWLNGLVTVKGKIPPFIVTLGMLGVARGVVLNLTQGMPIYGRESSFEFLAGRAGGVPIPLLVLLVVSSVLWVLLARTRFGRYTYALGGNREATRLSGIAVDRHSVVVFTLAGVCSGLAGLLNAARVASGQPNAGEGYELDAVAAAVIGGASLAGGEGSIPGTLIGAFLMGVLRNGCNLLNVPEGWQRVTIGTLIVVAVYYDTLRRRARERQ